MGFITKKKIKKRSPTLGFLEAKREEEWTEILKTEKSTRIRKKKNGQKD